MQSREVDFKEAIKAKDSQLAVLRVRLKERDDQFQEREEVIERLKVENEALSKEREENISNYDENLGSLKLRIRKLEDELMSQKDLLQQSQQESMKEVGRYQDTQRHLSEEIANLQRLYSLEKGNAKKFEKNLNSINLNYEAMKNDFEEYKSRAQRTLQSKDELIKALQSDESKNEMKQDLSKLNKVLQSQADEMVEELQELRKKNEILKKEFNQIKFEQIDKLHQNINSLSESLKEEKRAKFETEQELRQIQDELKYFQEDFNQTKSKLLTRIKDKDGEIEKLRKQLVSKRSASNANCSNEELETRIKNLTENLIQKQVYVEQLTSERHSLKLQLERTDKRLREALESASHVNGSTGSRAVTIEMVHSSSASNLVNRVRPLVEESPFDGQMTRRVKRAYGLIDSFRYDKYTFELQLK